MAIAFKCTQCSRDVDHANVMVNDDYFEAGINWLKVVCKECTDALDDRNKGQEMHNLWETSWIEKGPLYVMAGVISDLADGSQKWSKQALNDLFKIMQEAHPTLSADPAPM